MTASQTVPLSSLSTGTKRRYLSDWVLRLVDTYRKPIFATIVVIYLLGFTGQWRPEPDAALYLTIGRNIAEGRGYTYHGEPHDLAYPGLPWLLAGVFKVAGTHAMFVAHAVMLLIGFMCLALCYRLFILHADRPTAVLVTMGLGVSRLFYRYCYEIRSDIPFLLGILAFLCGFEAVFYASRKPVSDAASPRFRVQWYDWALLISGLALAIVMRPTMWALVLAIIFSAVRLLFMGQVRWAVVTVILIGGGLLGLAQLDPRHSTKATQGLGEYEQAVLDAATRSSELWQKILHVNLPTMFEPTAAEAMFGLDLGMGLNTALSIVAIGVGVSLIRQRALWGLLYIFTLLMMLAVLPLDRYFLAVLPLTVYGWWRLLVWIDHRLPDKWNRYAFAGLFLLGSGTNFSKICEWVFGQHERPLLVHYKDGRFADCPQLGPEMTKQLPSDAWVIGPQRMARVLTFYSRRNVIEPGEMSPQSTELNAWVHKVYVLNPDDAAVKEFLASGGFTVGPAIYTISHDGKTTWSLHPIIGKSKPA